VKVSVSGAARRWEGGKKKFGELERLRPFWRINWEIMLKLYRKGYQSHNRGEDFKE